MTLQGHEAWKLHSSGTFISGFLLDLTNWRHLYDLGRQQQNKDIIHSPVAAEEGVSQDVEGLVQAP